MLGSGPAGETAACKAAQLGAKVCWLLVLLAVVYLFCLFIFFVYWGEVYMYICGVWGGWAGGLVCVSCKAAQLGAEVCWLWGCHCCW